MSKVAFIFPGQGSQYVGMGKELYEGNETARKYFDEIFASMDLDLKEVMFNGPEDKLKQTKYTQPAIVAMSLVLAKLLEEKGVDGGEVVKALHDLMKRQTEQFQELMKGFGQVLEKDSGAEDPEKGA